jgi:hypothetical protein
VASSADSSAAGEPVDADVDPDVEVAGELVAEVDPDVVAEVVSEVVSDVVTEVVPEVVDGADAVVDGWSPDDSANAVPAVTVSAPATMAPTSSLLVIAVPSVAGQVPHNDGGGRAMGALPDG